MGAPATCLPAEPGLVGVRWMAGFVGALSLPLDGMSLCAVIRVNIVIAVYGGLRVYSVAVSQHEAQSTCDTVALVVYYKCGFLNSSQFP